MPAEKKVVKKACTCTASLKAFEAKVEAWLKQSTLRILEHEKEVAAKLAEVEATLAALPVKQYKPSTINRVEDFNGEVESVPYETSGMRMQEADKLVSMLNAVKILPPNMIRNGRHEKANVQALVGFTVTDEMMDDVYANYTHEV